MLCLKARLLSVRRLRKGAPVGYGRTYRVSTEDGERIHLEFSLRLYHRHELTRLLTGEGLAIREVLGGFGGEEYDFDSRRLILVSQEV